VTDRVPGQHDHVSLDILADAAEDLLTNDERDHVEKHLRTCVECAELARTLSVATDAIRDLAAPPMPSAVQERLIALVREESERRASGVAEAEEAAGVAEAAKRTDLGSFRQNPLITQKMPPRRMHLVGGRFPTRKPKK